MSPGSTVSAQEGTEWSRIDSLTDTFSQSARARIGIVMRSSPDVSHGREMPYRSLPTSTVRPLKATSWYGSASGTHRCKVGAEAARSRSQAMTTSGRSKSSTGTRRLVRLLPREHV